MREATGLIRLVGPESGARRVKIYDRALCEWIEQADQKDRSHCGPQALGDDDRTDRVESTGSTPHWHVPDKTSVQ